MDTSGAELGAGALVQETKTETKKEGQVTMAPQVTLDSPEAWSSFDFGGAGFYRRRNLFLGFSDSAHRISVFRSGGLYSKRHAEL